MGNEELGDTILMLQLGPGSWDSWGWESRVPGLFRVRNHTEAASLLGCIDCARLGRSSSPITLL